MTALGSESGSRFSILRCRRSAKPPFCVDKNLHRQARSNEIKLAPLNAGLGGFQIVPPLTDEYIRKVAAFKEVNPCPNLPGP
jgi:hypothetical protein